jgi:hypothetical protein
MTRLIVNVAILGAVVWVTRARTTTFGVAR